MSQAHLSNGTPPRHWVIIPAAGVGKRMQAHCPKQYLPFNGRTILEQTLSIFIDDGQFERVYLGLSVGDPYWPELAVSGHTKISVFEGGDERVDTVYQGLLAMADIATEDDFVWVHDAARPCLSQADIQALTEALEQSDEGALLAVKINDTVKRSTDAGLCETTVDREYLWRAMTPQVFRYKALKQALESCFEHQVFVTDDASAMEFVGAQPRLVAGSDHNIKITRPEDLANAEQYYQKMTAHEESPMIPRIGTGYDVHAFEEGEFVTIGGVQIPHTHGLKAHSDGDVLLHALADALLGALALGDIGKHFPDTDEKWKGADSRMLLRGVFDLIQEKGYQVGNVDLTVIAQAPKMAPHIEAIQANIADDLKLDVSCVGVKATTTEKLGFTGRKEGIAAQASALLFPAAGKPGY